MRNNFIIKGYGTNKRGLTVGINYQFVSSDAKTATSHAMSLAHNSGLAYVRLTSVREVSHA